MRYTFITENGTEKTVTIPDQVFQQGRKEGLTNKETIERFLSDEGYIINPVVAELTEKARVNNAGVRAKGTERKKPIRKPDEVKRALIALLEDSLKDNADGPYLIENIEVTNIERIITFQIGEDKYELTLSKKRKPKT